jgi:succinyl-diaminopimelate desuccinylase
MPSRRFIMSIVAGVAVIGLVASGVYLWVGGHLNPLFAAADQPACDEPEQVIVIADTSIAPSVAELAADFDADPPTRAEVEGGCNGTLRAELRATGRRAHSARSWVGENAIHKLAPALERLAAYEAETVRVDGLDYREGLNAVLVGGGVAGNVIPDEAVLTLNYRFAPSRSVADATAHVRELFPEYEVTVTDSAEGARPGLDDPLAQQFVQAVGAEARPKYGWTDVARFSALGIPAVNFGPGDPLLAHADDERVDCDEIVACERALRAWLGGSAA